MPGKTSLPERQQGAEPGPLSRFKYLKTRNQIKLNDYKDVLEFQPGLGKHRLSGKGLVGLIMLQLCTGK